MDEFYIEINEAQPIRKAEAKLKELGYKVLKGGEAQRTTSFVATYWDGYYACFTYYKRWESVPLKTLDEL